MCNGSFFTRPHLEVNQLQMVVSDRQMAVCGEKTQSPNGSKPKEVDTDVGKLRAGCPLADCRKSNEAT